MSANGSAEPPSGRARAPHLVLVGLPGAGKSTVGPLVAHAMGRAFIDLDREIERRVRRSAAEFLASAGEAAFRLQESALTRELLEEAESPLVIATGGGWVESSSSPAGSQGGILTVYLRAELPTLLARLATSEVRRPLLEGATTEILLDQLLRRRERLYLQSNHIVNVDMLTPEEVALSIVALASTRDAD